MSQKQFNIQKNDVNILRHLAREVIQREQSEINLERKNAWLAFANNNAYRPLVLTETDGGLQLINPHHSLMCKEYWAKEIEHRWKEMILHFDTIKDDRVIQANAHWSWHIDLGNFGVDTERKRGVDSHGGQTGYEIIYPIKNIETDLHLLKSRNFNVNRETSILQKQCLEDTLGDLVTIRPRGFPAWSLGLSRHAIMLIGLEQFLVSMFESPDKLHQLMDFLREDTLKLLNWLESEKILCLNNEQDYIGSGSFGWTDQLPTKEFNGTPRLCDLWFLFESQETSCVGSKQFEEFVFNYAKPIFEKIGYIYYGCCEPVHTIWHLLKTVTNIKRVSCSPWTDQDFMAKALGDQYGFSRKPSPTLVSTNVFDEDLIRNDLGITLKACIKHGVRNLEFVMKDVHTLNNEPWRLARWVEITREEIQKYYK